MINLITIDEELLLKNGKLLKSTEELISSLAKQGIKIAVISSKSYHRLHNLFSGSLENICFVCNDGGLTVFEDNVIDSKVIDRHTLVAFKDTVSRLPGSEIILSFKDSDETISEDGISLFIKDITKLTLHLENAGIALLSLTPDLHKNGLKISNYDENSVELVRNDAARAAAVAYIRRRFGIFKKETVSFLKSDKSADLILHAEVAIASFDASLELQKKAGHVTESALDDMKLILKALCK